METSVNIAGTGQICLVIPCYNEQSRMPAGEIIAFMESHPEMLLCLVDDCSTDKTVEVLISVERLFPGRVMIVRQKKNTGKAEAVRQGMNEAARRFRFSYIGYFDADLSTPLDACFQLRESIESKETCVFSFGSRLAIIGSKIERKLYRHLLGRTIATLISNILGLKVYDTQCGAKLFRAEVAEKLFAEPFYTTWVFDVEIFARIIGLYGRDRAESMMTETPLMQWIDKGGSKIESSYAFRVFADLFRIRKRYSAILR